MSVTESNVLDTLYSGTTTALDFHYDNLMAPPIGWLLSLMDINNLHSIAMSARLAGDKRKKLQCIRDILKPKGFIHLAGGTNRVVYYHPDVPGVVYKIALDATGIGDNPAEFMNQRLIKPYCCKVFECTPCGTVASFERVERITSIEEFASVSEDIYYIISRILIGKYVLEDIGINFFLNWGLRTRSSSGYAFGPVILDFPYIYELDGAKLFCNKMMDDGHVCGGEIDYDDGFNFLKCTKCGAMYRARDLAKPNRKGSGILIRKKGRLDNMEITLVRGNDVVSKFHEADTVEYMKKPAIAKSWKNRVQGNTDPITSKWDIQKDPIVSLKKGNKIVDIDIEDRTVYHDEDDAGVMIVRGSKEEKSSNDTKDNNTSPNANVVAKVFRITPDDNIGKETKKEEKKEDNRTLLEKITRTSTKENDLGIVKAEPPVEKEESDDDMENRVDVIEEEEPTKNPELEESSEDSPTVVISEIDFGDNGIFSNKTNEQFEDLVSRIEDSINSNDAEEDNNYDDEQTEEELHDSVNIKEEITLSYDHSEEDTKDKISESHAEKDDNKPSTEFQMNAKTKQSIGDFLDNY